VKPWHDKALGISALGLSGVAAYLFLAVGAHALGPARFAPLGALWACVFLATAALSAPLEIELARRVGAARGRGARYHGEIGAALSLAVMIGVLAVVLAVVCGSLLDTTVFAGVTGYTLAGAVAFFGLMLGAAHKGAFAGSGRLAWWGTYLVVDGGTRFGFSVVASVLDPRPHAFALALAAGPWVALLVTLPPMRRLAAGSRMTLTTGIVELGVGASPVVVSAVASSVLTYAGAVMLPVLVPGPDARVGAYIAALSMARLPLFAFSPLIAIAVPRIAYSVTYGDAHATWQTAVLLIGSAAAVGIIGVAAGWVAGAGALALLFGQGFVVSSSSLLAVAVAAAAWLVATASAAASVAAGRAWLAAGGWCAGLAVAVILAVPAGSDPFSRTNFTVAAGGVMAATATVAAAAIALRAHPDKRTIR
jgi:O-antigen/teichoic acid export membrane protein